MPSVECFFVNRSRHQCLYAAVLQVFARTLKRRFRGSIGFGRRSTQGNRSIVGIAAYQIQPAVLRLTRIVDGVPLDISPFLAKSLDMMFGNHCIAVNNGFAQFEHVPFQQGFDDYFISYTVGISGCNSYRRFHKITNYKSIFLVVYFGVRQFVQVILLALLIFVSERDYA